LQAIYTTAFTDAAKNCHVHEFIIANHHIKTVAHNSVSEKYSSSDFIVVWFIDKNEYIRVASEKNK